MVFAPIEKDSDLTLNFVIVDQNYLWVTFLYILINEKSLKVLKKVLSTSEVKIRKIFINKITKEQIKQQAFYGFSSSHHTPVIKVKKSILL